MLIFVWPWRSQEMGKNSPVRELLAVLLHLPDWNTDWQSLDKHSSFILLVIGFIMKVHVPCICTEGYFLATTESFRFHRLLRRWHTEASGEHNLGLLSLLRQMGSSLSASSHVLQIHTSSYSRNLGITYLHNRLKLTTLIFSDKIPQDDVTGVYVQIL